MDLNLRGRTALITGASKGIGIASAEALAAEGVNVILVSRTQSDLDAAREKIAARHNVSVQVHAYDLSDSRNVDRLVADAPRHRHPGQQRRRHPGRRPLANHRGPLAPGLGPEGLRLHQHVPRLLCRNETRGRGVIINILGMAGEKMDRGYIAGSTGNAALMAFTRALGGSAGDDKLRVVGINPGAVATDRLVTLMKGRAKERFGDENRWQELTRPCRWAALVSRRKSPRWLRSWRRTCQRTPQGRSSPSTAARQIAARCSERSEG